MQSTSESMSQGAGEAQLPPHLEQRFNEESERFHHTQTVDQDLAATTQRQEAILQERVQHAHAEVEHAKQVAASHHRQQQEQTSETGIIGGGVEEGVPMLGARVQGQPTAAATGEGVTGSNTSSEGVETLSREVQEKQRHVQQQQAELSDLDARLERAAQVERDLRARLGEAV